MQTYRLSFNNAALHSEWRDKAFESLGTRPHELIDHGQVVGKEIEAPVIETQGDNLPVVISPGKYGPSTWVFEVVIYDDLSPPVWPKEATVTPMTSSLAFAPDEPRPQTSAQTPAPLPDESWKVVPLWKLRTVAEATGLLPIIEKMIEDMPDSQEKIAARNAIQYAPEISVNGVLLNALWPLTGLTEEDKEKLFKAAHAIQA